VLIVHFNTPNITSRLIQNFPRLTSRGRSVRVHVLDNCSSQQNLCNLRAQIGNLPTVDLEVSDTNIGFGAGMNYLAGSDDINGSDILWILNSDVALTPGCLDTLEDELDSGCFAAISPLIYSGSNTDSLIWYCGGSVSTPDLRAKLDLYGRRLSESPTCSFETQFLAGTAPMMRASTFRAVGGFPADYFLYWEDVYFSWKANQLGLRLGVVPTAQLWHAIGASSGSGLSRTFYYWSARNRFTFARDLGISRHRLVLGRGGVESLRPVARAVFVEREGRLSKAGAAIKGTLDGLRQSRR